MEITREILREITCNAIKAARKNIYKKIRLRADENSFYFPIAIRLAVELDRKNLSMYSVDTNYNRATGIDGTGKGIGIYNEEERAVEYSGRNQFDIIVHMNGDGDIDCPENLIHIENKLTLIEESNKEIFKEYKIDYPKTDKWFANIVAGYQLGAFIDIGLEDVEITYYYDGAEWESESVSILVEK